MPLPSERAFAAIASRRPFATESFFTAVAFGGRLPGVRISAPVWSVHEPRVDPVDCCLGVAPAGVAGFRADGAIPACGGCFGGLAATPAGGAAAGTATGGAAAGAGFVVTATCGPHHALLTPSESNVRLFTGVLL